RNLKLAASSRTWMFGGAVSLSVLFTFGMVGGVDAASLADTVQFTIRTNPEVLQSAANRRAIDFELRQAEGLYFPQIDLRAGVGPEWTRNTTVKPNTTLTRYESRVTLQQRVFDGFEAQSEKERQAARIDAAASRVRERSEFLGLNAVEFYLDVLRTTAIVEQAVANMQAHKRILGSVRTRFRGGQSGVGDVHQAEARLANAEGDLIETRRTQREAVIRFQRVVGQEPEDLVRPAMDESALPGSSFEAVEIGLQNNPTVKLAQADVDVSKAEISATKSDFWPAVDLELSASANKNLDGVRGSNNDASALVVFSYNLYRGGIDEAEKFEFVERHAESLERLSTLKRAVAEDVRQSWNGMTKARERLGALNDQVVADEKVVIIYRQEFQIGQRDLLDLLDSENERFNSRIRAITADYTAQFGGYRVLASMGQLLNVLGVTPIKEATGGQRDKTGRTPDSRWMTSDPMAGEGKTVAAVEKKEAVTAKEPVPAAAAEAVTTAPGQALAKTDAAGADGKPVTSELKVEPAAGQAGPPEVVTLNTLEWNNAW
ncbi:MAG: TolC family outer membrane protein, partial [Alphaproteobacteria bacterium]|nr:TolC family outer membrane protein [Alphaproteobacteria bacterium]